MRWIYFPPVFSFFLLLATLIFHRNEAASAVPSVVWGLAIAAYICFCGLSVFFITKRDTQYNLGIALLAQGVLLSVMAIQAGAIFMSWIGLLLFLFGLFIAFFYATRSHSAAADDTRQTSSETSQSPDKLLNKLEIPLCYTDSKGFIAGMTNSFLAAVGKSTDAVLGEAITSILPPDSKEAVLPTGHWWISQIKEGARHYFYLLPTRDGLPTDDAHAGKSASPSASFIDAETGLYTDYYRKMRGPEEVARAQRYKRSLSAMLLELTFDLSTGVSLTDDQTGMLNKAFATKLKDTLRNIDCVFWMDDHKKILLIMPETPQAGAKTLMSRLLLLPQDIFDEGIRLAVNPKVRAGLYFYNGATKLDYSVFMASLEQAFDNAVDGSPGISNNSAKG